MSLINSYEQALEFVLLLVAEACYLVSANGVEENVRNICVEFLEGDFDKWFDSYGISLGVNNAIDAEIAKERKYGFYTKKMRQ